MKYLVLAAAAAIVAAECPNACSGNGECGTKDQCVCYDGFIGADCSQRVCPFSRAFVDVPNGDLNHDGVLGISGKASTYSKVSWSRYRQPEYWPTKEGTGAIANFDSPTSAGYRGVDPSKTKGLGWYAAKDEAHWAQECAGKGFCDRALGECVCFDGYTGSACQRTTCPNDCSGHGRCKTVGDIAAGALNKKFVDSYAGENFYSGVEAPFEYRLWDSDKNQACVCDTGYGGVDCSLRECPRGDDPLTAVEATCGGKACENEVQAFILQGTATNDGTKYMVKFNDYNGNVYTSDAFTFSTTDYDDATDNKDLNAVNAAALETALEAIPNEIVGKNVTVSAEKLDGEMRTNIVFKVTFTDLSGNVPEFSVVRADEKVGLEAVSQPSQPIQTLDLTGLTGTLDLTVSLLDDTGYRASQLKGSLNTAAADIPAAIVTALSDATAVEYELGSTPASVVESGSKYYIIFAKNANRPNAARLVGTNPLRLVAGGITQATATVWSSNGNTEYSICSNRGVCDYSSGICACFPGYTGEACSAQNALAM